jgi:peptidyl-prolyl cis-trans isomerase C
LKPGEISEVVVSQFGFHVIKLIEKKDATVVPLEQVKPRVQEFLTNRKKQEKVDALIKDAKAKAKIEVLV